MPPSPPPRARRLFLRLLSLPVDRKIPLPTPPRPSLLLPPYRRLAPHPRPPPSPPLHVQLVLYALLACKKKKRSARTRTAVV